MRVPFLAIVLLLLAKAQVCSQPKPLSQQMAAMAMAKWKDSLVTASSKDGRARWNYQESVVLRGMEEIYKTTGDKKYFDYIKKHVDYYVNGDGSIRTYKQDESK